MYTFRCKGKVIVMSLIVGRAFSKNTSLDLHYEFGRNSWIDLFDRVYDFLDELNVELSLGKIKKWKDVWMHKGNESPLSHLVRHTDALPKKINSILIK